MNQQPAMAFPKQHLGGMPAINAKPNPQILQTALDTPNKKAYNPIMRDLARFHTL